MTSERMGKLTTRVMHFQITDREAGEMTVGKRDETGTFTKSATGTYVLDGRQMTLTLSPIGAGRESVMTLRRMLTLDEINAAIAPLSGAWRIAEDPAGRYRNSHLVFAPPSRPRANGRIIRLSEKYGMNGDNWQLIDQEGDQLRIGILLARVESVDHIEEEAVCRLDGESLTMQFKDDDSPVRLVRAEADAKIAASLQPILGSWVVLPDKGQDEVRQETQLQFDLAPAGLPYQLFYVESRAGDLGRDLVICKLVGIDGDSIRMENAEHPRLYLILRVNDGGKSLGINYFDKEDASGPTSTMTLRRPPPPETATEP